MAASAEATVLERAPELAETAPDIFEALAKAPGAAEAFGAAAAQHYLSLLGGTPGEFAKSTSTGPVASPKSWFRRSLLVAGQRRNRVPQYAVIRNV